MKCAFLWNSNSQTEKAGANALSANTSGQGRGSDIFQTPDGGCLAMSCALGWDNTRRTDAHHPICNRKAVEIAKHSGLFLGFLYSGVASSCAQ